MAKGKSRNTRPAAKARPAKTAGRHVGETDVARPARPSAKDAAARAVAKGSSKDAPEPGTKGPGEDAEASTGAGTSAGGPSDTDRVGAKKPGPRPRPGPTKRTTPPASSRYTPPVPRAEKVSPIWVPIVMFSCLIVGMLIIILNYVNVLPGSDPSNVYLMVGLGLITVGFITATKFH